MTPESPSKSGEANESPSGAQNSADLPNVTHLQFLVLDVMMPKASGISSHELRDELARCGQVQEGPKFYQLMKRIEVMGMVQSWPQEFDVAGTTVTRTFYKVSRQGKTAWRLTMEFYATRLKLKINMSKQ